MDWKDDRLSRRLTFSAERTEELFPILSNIGAIKNAFRLTDKLLPNDQSPDAICDLHLNRRIEPD